VFLSATTVCELLQTVDLAKTRIRTNWNKWYRPQAVSIDKDENVFVTDLHRLIRIPKDQLNDQSSGVVVITGSKGMFPFLLNETPLKS
jgi:hypothetical protein